MSEGTAGIAVALWYLAEGDANAESLARRVLDESVEAAGDLSPWLFGGLAGIGWAYSHLASRLPPGDSWDDPADELDSGILDLLSRAPWDDDYDLICGLVGYGVYALERERGPRADSIVAHVVRHLAESARAVDGGLTWWTPPDLVPATRREEFPDGMFNLGVAHGVAGPVAFLARASRTDLAEARLASELLEGAVTWLLRQSMSGVGSRFPKWILPGVPLEESRQAWCYGDPGVAAALFLAARAAQRHDWEHDAVDLALHTARRSPETSGVVDVSLCHGAGGLAHVFNRLYQATGEPALRDGATYWAERTIEMIVPPGAPAIASEDATGPGDVSLLNGEAGAALALLAAATPVEPEWDRLFLLSGPEIR